MIVLGRILVEAGSPRPAVADSSLLLIKRHDVTIGCTPGDAGTIADAATDAPDPPPDAATADAGLPDGGMPDAGTCEMIAGDAVTMIVQPEVSTGADGTR